jgi:uncharacterized cupredoxin-like copper-binding protein
MTLAGALAACGGSTASPSSPVTATPPPAETTTATVNGSEFAFDPGTIDVAAGSKVTLTLANKGTIEHDLTIDSLAIKLVAPAGQSQAVTTDALAAGTYEFYCSIPGHKDAGMTGTLTVK